MMYIGSVCRTETKLQSAHGPGCTFCVCVGKLIGFICNQNKHHVQFRPHLLQVLNLHKDVVLWRMIPIQMFLIDVFSYIIIIQ